MWKTAYVKWILSWRKWGLKTNLQSTGFHSTMCERNLRITDLSGTEKNNVGVEISIGSCLVYWRRSLYSLPHLTFLLSFHVCANRLEWPLYLCSQCVFRQTMIFTLSRTHLLQNISWDTQKNVSLACTWKRLLCSKVRERHLGSDLWEESKCQNLAQAETMQPLWPGWWQQAMDSPHWWLIRVSADFIIFCSQDFSAWFLQAGWRMQQPCCSWHCSLARNTCTQCWPLVTSAASCDSSISCSWCS